VIPKIIWQTHECPYEELPEIYKINSQTYKDLGWDYRYSSALDRESFIAEHFPQYLHLYNHIGPGIFKSDLWRYLVLYKYGGIYVDMDSRIYYDPANDFAKSINDPDATFNVIWATDPIFNNCVIMCSEANPIMKDVVETVTGKCQEFYNEGWEIFPHPRWIDATGPTIYTSVVSKYMDQISYIYTPGEEVDQLSIHHFDVFKDQMDRDSAANMVLELGKR
jgi:mannosyltransferase OCH1-like enzyme